MKHEFVEFIPEELKAGVIYISIEFGTVAHNCACGCGSETVTPLSPREWSLTYNGESVTLYPSIGNWSLPCKSHYWIRNGEVVWAETWTEKEIQAGRNFESGEQIRYYDREAHDPKESNSEIKRERPVAFWQRMWLWISQK